MPMTDATKWNQRYLSSDVPWDTGQPSTELQRILREHNIQPCRALDLGCGTGTNSVWLAQHSFDVTGLDIAPLAIAKADQQARAAGVAVRFLVADVLEPLDLGDPFGFFFDRGCYHAVRRENPAGYAPAVARLLLPGAYGLVLAGNSREAHEERPTVVTEEALRTELGEHFRIIDLSEFRFDAPPGSNESFLAWSCLMTK
jgi:SAM-dependent methyltransferase